jgi:hypothetical protein
VSFRKVQKQSASLNERQSLTELRVTCAVAGQWEEADFTAAWAVTKGENSEHREIAVVYKMVNVSEVV